MTHDEMLARFAKLDDRPPLFEGRVRLRKRAAPVGRRSERQDAPRARLDPKDEHAVGEAEAPKHRRSLSSLNSTGEDTHGTKERGE